MDSAVFFDEASVAMNERDEIDSPILLYQSQSPEPRSWGVFLAAQQSLTTEPRLFLNDSQKMKSSAAATRGRISTKYYQSTTYSRGSSRVPSLETDSVSSSSGVFSPASSIGSEDGLFRQHSNQSTSSDASSSSSAAAVTYPCPFYFLPGRRSCTKSFESFEQWVYHGMAHMYPHDPPTFFTCPLCGESGRYETGRHAWAARSQHVAGHHRNGQSLVRAKPEPEFHKYLWKKDVITALEYRSLCDQSGSFAQLQQVWVMESPRERRRHPR